MDPYTRLTLIAFLLFMARGMTGPLSSIYWRSLGASYLSIGLLGTVMSIVAIGASYIWGRASDRAGQRKGFLLGGLAGLALCFVLLGVTRGADVLFPIYALVALSQAAYDVASLALMGDWLEHRERLGGGDGTVSTGRRMGTYRGLASLGFGLMAFVSGFIADLVSLRVPFLLAAGFFGMAFLMALWVGEPPDAAVGAEFDPEPAARSEPLPRG